MRLADAARLDDRDFAAALRLVQTVDEGRDPDLTPSTDTEVRLRFTVDRSDHARHDRVVAFDGRRAVALGHLERTRDPANRSIVTCEIDHLDDQDPALAVLNRMLDLAETDGRTSLMSWAPFTDANDSFWTGLGAERRYTERQSDLRLDHVDADLMARWIAARHDRAADIELVEWAGAVPAELAAANLVAVNAMNDAPIDDLEIADRILTEADIDEGHRAWSALGFELRSLLALAPDGSPAGLTSVLVNTHRPEASWQWDTVVPVEHRRRGIGRWIKAEMWTRLRSERPDLTRLRTGNAESNAAMLAINVAMGFREVHVMAVWQAPIVTLRAGLDQRLG